MARQNIDALIAPIVEAEGFEFVGTEYLPQGKHSVLRIYIDHKGGVKLDECAVVSGQISAVLDVEDPIHGAYSLEVSSPGMHRPLFTLEHFQRFQGQRVKIRLHELVNERRNLLGIIKEVTDEDIHFIDDDTEQVFVLRMEQIDKASLMGEDN